MNKKVASFSKKESVLFRVFRGKDETTFANKKKDFGVSFFIYTTDSRCLETQLGETVKGVFVNMLCPWLDDRVVGIGML